MKIVKCIKCGQGFEMPDNFFRTIICEACDPAMNPEEPKDYKRLYDIEHRRRVAAEARFKAAEKVISEFIDLDDNEYCTSETWRDFRDWQQSIIDYNKTIKEAGE